MKKLFAQIMAIAIPSILQQSVLSVGNLFVQGIVNQFGSAVVAGYSGAIKLNTFAINIFMTLGSCLSSYTAQNIGAGKNRTLVFEKKGEDFKFFFGKLYFFSVDGTAFFATVEL